MKKLIILILAVCMVALMGCGVEMTPESNAESNPVYEHKILGIEGNVVRIESYRYFYSETLTYIEPHTIAKAIETIQNLTLSREVYETRHMEVFLSFDVIFDDDSKINISISSVCTSSTCPETGDSSSYCLHFLQLSQENEKLRTHEILTFSPYFTAFRALLDFIHNTPCEASTTTD